MFTMMQSLQPQPTVMYYSVELKACRACLTTETNLYNLHGRLALSFEYLTGTPVSVTDGLPQHICSVCRAQLRKCAAFRAKCRQAHITLQDARVKTPMITTFYIRNLDTINLKLHLSKTQTLTLEYLPKTNLESSEEQVQDDDVQSPAIIEVIDDDEAQSLAGSFRVMQEDEDVQFVSCNDNGLETYCIEMSDDEDNIDAINDFMTYHPPVEEIKIEENEIGYDSFYNTKNFLSSNEEQENINAFKFESTIVPTKAEEQYEDLSKTMERDEIRKHTDNEEEKPLENPNNNKQIILNDGETKEVNPNKVKKKRARIRRGKLRNLKTKEDFVSFSKLYNVKVKV